MKKVIFALAAAALLFSACNKDDDGPLPVKTIKPGDTVTLQHGQSALLEPDNLEITFLKVKEDSRCPKDAICVWEGRAVVELRFAKPDGVIMDSLATISTMPTPPDSVVVFNRTVKLLEVTPYPETSAAIPQHDYKVKILVK